ncbi:MAG: hypothetical protein Q8O33_09660 [Pseudomonadota bacterium]|nr:hypothetical protein [Pseudomonadota bacterium]
MTRDQAFAKAGKLSRQRGEPMYVVFDPSSEAGPWQVSTESGLDTFYLGCSDVTEVTD